MSKIINLQASNYKILKAIDITPEGNVVVVSGRNGQGKTSVLDAITAALGGINSKTTPRPIRDGETKAEIVLELDDLIVTRTFTGGTSKLVVKGKDGATFGKGQAKLDELLGRLSLDPLAFTQLSERDQLKTLLDLVDLPFDPAALEAERVDVFGQRTDVNRRVKELQAQVARFQPSPADLPAVEVSVSALLTEYRAAEAVITEQRAAYDAMNRCKEKVSYLEAQLADARKALKDASTAVVGYDNVPVPDLQAIQARIDGAESTNALVRVGVEKRRLEAQLVIAEQEASDLTEGITEIDAQKAEGLAAAKFPVDGLGFDAEGVTYQGIPFKQASSAEQLRVSLAMAIALNPSLRVIRIADGSLLDSTSLGLVEEMAAANDFQVWIEMVDETGDLGIVIEDGEVQA